MTESEVTSPPTYIRDCISGEYSIYYANGDIVPSTYEECKNLEVCAVWELSHVIDRLMGMTNGKNVWHYKDNLFLITLH